MEMFSVMCYVGSLILVSWDSECQLRGIMPKCNCDIWIERL